MGTVTIRGPASNAGRAAGSLRPVFLVAVSAAGRAFQLNRNPDGRRHAERLARRAARLLSRIGTPATWTGAVVTVTEARTRAAVVSVPVPTPRAAPASPPGVTQPMTDVLRRYQVLSASELNRRGHELLALGQELLDAIDDFEVSNADGNVLVALDRAGLPGGGAADQDDPLTSLEVMAGNVTGFRWTLAIWLDLFRGRLLPLPVHAAKVGKGGVR